MFLLVNFFVSQNVDRNFSFFFYLNFRRSEESQKVFFKIFKQFFAELWPFKIFERSFCYEISKVQWDFFSKRVLFIHK